MNFLKTFFGQILRKSDVDFQNLGARSSSVNTHIDYTSTNGGVINGLDVFISSDGKSLIVTPGVFYSRGEFSNQNASGGGERCELFTAQTISNLPHTATVGANQKYILIYAYPISQNSNPDPSKSQVVVTSKNLQTGESVAVREYNRASISASTPIFESEAYSSYTAVPLALVQVASDGTITFLDTSVKLEYKIADVVNIPQQKISNLGIADNAIVSSMISGSQVLSRHFADGAIESAELAAWDGQSVTHSSGSGVATAHFKNGAVLSNNISSTGSLYGYSSRNYVFNSSFEVDPILATDPDIVGWKTFNEVSSDVAYSGPAAGVFRVANGRNGLKSVIMQGADPSLTTGGGVRSVALYQDVFFPDKKLNDQNVMASFYMKTNNNYPVGVIGVTGMTATIQFLSSGTPIGSQTQIVNYAGPLIDWTKFETTEPVLYQGSSSADGIRFMVSGNITNAVDVFVDDFYVGLTNIAPMWSPAPEDATYSDTLTKANIYATNFASTNASVLNVNARNLIPSISNTGSSTTASASYAYISNASNSLIAVSPRTTGSSFYFAQKFTSTTATTITSAIISAGLGTGTLFSPGTLAYTSFKICSDNSGTPNLSGVIGVIGTSQVATTDPVSVSTITYNGGSASLNASTQYWMVFEVPYSYISISKVAIAGVAGTGCIVSNDGLTWTPNLDSNTVVTPPVMLWNPFVGGGTWVVSVPGYSTTTNTTMSSMFFALYDYVTTSTSVATTSASLGYSSIGSLSEPFGSISTNSMLVDGVQISNANRQFKTVLGTGVTSWTNPTGATATIIPWTVPQGITSIIVEMVAGGGGGIAGTNQQGQGTGEPYSGGGGGGAGEYVLQRIPVVPGEILNIEAGHGGAGGGGHTTRASLPSAGPYYGKRGGNSRIVRVSDGSILAIANGGWGSDYSTSTIRGGGYGGSWDGLHTGIPLYTANKISIPGQDGSSGGQASNAGSWSAAIFSAENSGTNWVGLTYTCGGGRGGAWNFKYFNADRSHGGQGIEVYSKTYTVPGGSTINGYHMFNTALVGASGSFPGGGGGGGGGSTSSVAAPAWHYPSVGGSAAEASSITSAGGSLAFPQYITPSYGITAYETGDNAGSGGDGAPGIVIIYF
jgi:hypothetical protein